MLPALSEPVALPPGRSVRLERVEQAEGSPPPERFLHFHGPAELVFMEEGCGSFVHEGPACAFGPGSLLYAPGMAIHDFAFAPGARRWTLVQFDPLALDPRLPPLPAAACAAQAGWPGSARAAVLLEWLAATLAQGAPEAEVLVVLEALLLSLRGAFGPSQPDTAPRSAGLAHFRPLLQHWETAPGKPLSLAEAASLCALSASYFSRLFARTFGAGFVTYQTRFRLQQAARMLATEDVPVSQIGYRTGFRSHAYFSECYKAMFGVSPSEHRRMTGSTRPAHPVGAARQGRRAGA